MDYQEFLINQRKIYEKFEKGSIEAISKGFAPDPVLVEERAGFFIALKPNPSFAETISKIGKNVANIMPVITYTKNMLHTAISDMLTENGKLPEIKEGLILKEIVEEVKLQHGPIFCRYTNLAYNRNTFIIKGIPNEEFIRTALLIKEAGEKRGVNLRLPWGGHMTFARVNASFFPTHSLIFKNFTPCISQLSDLQLVRFHATMSNFTTEII